MAPQAAVRRRGGTHRVKDADLTNTKFDNYNYQELKDECIERGLWIKDMKKVAMAQALAKNESEKKQTENAARHEKANREHWAALQKQREDERKLKEGAEKRKKQMEKQKRREIDGNVSEDTMDEELEQMHEQILEATGNQRSSDAGGEWLSSEESWRSDSTDTTFHSTEPPILPQDRLRLFEWTYIEMPSPVARSAPSVLPSIDFNSQMNLPSSPTNMFVREPPVPRNIPYVPLKVYTTETKQKLFLPGLTYPPNIDPDYVPVLTQQTRDAARNGVLEGVLRKATIERASAWSARTQIQGWNARMFFNLPPCNPSKKLPDVYTKWCSKNRELFDVKPGTVGFKVNRRQRHVQRHAQRHKNKSKRQAEVLEASEYRPAAVCYIPAYLDFGESENRYSREESGHILENLFFICFPGCDVPHYYFWVRKGQWADPTKPNPGWTPQDEDADDQDKSTDESENESDTPQSARYSISRKRLPKLARRTRKALVRVKNDATPPSPVSPSVPPSIANTLEHFRYELYTYGLSATLSKCRMKWVRNGKEDAWTAFSKDMPLRYPNGKLPDTPPVDGKGVVSLTMKLASIELVGIKTKLSPFTGDEPWTEDDNDLWSVVEIRVEDTGTSVEDVTSEKVDMNQDMEVLDPKDLEALYRRSSFQPPSRLSSNDCAAWLTQVSPSFIPLSPGSLPTSPVLEDVDTLARKEWEDLFMQQAQRGLDVLCPFCSQRLSGFSFEVRSPCHLDVAMNDPTNNPTGPSNPHVLPQRHVPGPTAPPPIHNTPARDPFPSVPQTQPLYRHMPCFLLRRHRLGDRQRAHAASHLHQNRR
jgi:hypothetical protein